MTERPTVLVVEDERDLADLYANWLDDEYDVRTAYSAEEAMDELSEAVDVVLLDRRLPETSGDDVLSSILDADCECAVAMVTAVDPDFDIIDLGFDDYVVKPVDRTTLLDLVGRLLRRSLYNDEVRRYFALVSTRASLESTKPSAELDASDRYQTLLADIEEAESTLDEIVGRFTEDDFLALVHAIGAD